MLRWQQLFPEEKNLKALQTLFRQLEKQPRTKEGVWWHKAIYKKQVWLDGIFMGLPFYTHSASYLNKKEKKVFDALLDLVDEMAKVLADCDDDLTELYEEVADLEEEVEDIDDVLDELLDDDYDDDYDDFDDLDDTFVENEEQWTATVASYIDDHIDRFATILGKEE